MTIFLIFLFELCELTVIWLLQVTGCSDDRDKWNIILITYRSDFHLVSNNAAAIEFSLGT